MNTAPNRAPEGAPRTTLARRSPLPALLVGLTVLAGGGALVWAYLNRTEPIQEPAPAGAVAQAASEAVPAEGPAPAPATTQGLLEAVSPNALLRGLLAKGEEIRRWAVVAANVAYGESPRRELGALAPEGKFSVETAGDTTVIAPASYARYDAFGDAVASVDVAALASAWRALRPALQAAYRPLGYPAPSIDAAMLRALRRLQEAPLRVEPVRVVADGSVYVFVDPALERLGAVEKHLLRMGPRNTRIVQEKAREIEAALGLATPRVASEAR